jgi:cytoskeletal protein RodZ
MSKQNLHITREQIERLAELGNRLKELRQQKGMTLEEVANRTRIQPRLLRAIEAGERNELPEAVYVQGFIRQYANAIGLNGVEFASEFPMPFTQMAASRSVWYNLPGAQLRPVHLYGIYLVLMITAVSTLSYVINRSSTSTQLAALENLQRSLPTNATAIGPVLPNPTLGVVTPSVSSPINANKSVRVGLKLTSQSWIRVLVDGKVDFEGVLPEGSQRTWIAAKQVVLRAGDAGGVMVSFNDSQSKPLGEPGSVEEVAFPPERRMANLPEELGN